ncbi:DinB family protein [Acidobacteria bacterium AB60]|nr:DinB family protein [Acidobacteria bacterium AB60]
MELKSYLLAQLEREAALTRKAIDRVPEGQNDFKPHEKSMPLGYLSALVANMLGWIALMIDHDELSINEAGGEFRPQVVSTRAELVAALDKQVAEARRALSGTTDEHLLTPWAFKMNGQVVQQQPRHLMITDSVYSHLAHHRGQLTVYLRLNEARVPALYGPSADERF